MHALATLLVTFLTLVSGTISNATTQATIAFENLGNSLTHLTLATPDVPYRAPQTAAAATPSNSSTSIPLPGTPQPSAQAATSSATPSTPYAAAPYRKSSSPTPATPATTAEPLAEVALVHTDTLADRLAAIEAKLTAQISAIQNPPPFPQQVAAAGSNFGAGSGYIPAASQRIDQLANTTITTPTINNPVITGGSITSTSISGTIANVINTALATIDSLTANNLVAINSTTTNATTTNLTVSGTSTLSAVKLAQNCTSYGNGGKLTTDAFGDVICATDQGGAGSTVAGSDSQVQFNNAGTFGASAGFTFSTSTNKLTVTNASTTNLSATSLVAATWDGYAPSDLLANGFATSSADYWKSIRDLFSTTSASYFLAQNQGAAFSTSSASYFLGQNTGAAFSTTSSNYLLSTYDKGFFYSSTSANAWLATKSTSALAEGTNLYYQDARVNAYVHASTTIAKTYTTNIFTAGNTFTGAITFGSLNGPLDAHNGIVGATTSIGVVYGGTGSTTLSGILKGNGTNQVATAIAGTDYETPLTFSAPLSRIGNAISLSTAGDWSGTLGGFSAPQLIAAGFSTSSASYFLAQNQGLAFSTTSADAWKAQRSFFATSSSDYWLTTKTTDNLAQGAANKYYATSLFATDLAATTTDALAQGVTNKYWTNSLFDARLAATTSLPNITTLANLSLPTTQLTNFGTPFFQFFSATTTTALTEGANLYFTNNRVASVIAGTTTTALAEGSNLYFTPVRADARINATSSIGTLTAAPSLGTVATSLTGFLKATAGVLSTALVDLTANATGILPVSNGGTGWGNIASGAILFGSGTGALATTTAATPGQVLAFLGGLPTWTATTTYSSGLSYSNGNVTNTGVTSNIAGTGISISGATGAVTVNFAAPASGALSIPYASTTMVTATTASSTNLYVSSVASALHLSDATGKVTAYTGTSCTNQFVRSLNGSGVATCASVQNTDLANSSVTVNTGTGLSGGGSVSLGGTLTFTNTIGYPFVGNATSTTITFNTGLLSFASTTIGSGTQAGGLTISGGATTTGNAYFAGNVGIGTTTPQNALSVNGAGDFTQGSTGSAGNYVRVYSAVDGVNAGVIGLEKFGSAAASYGPYSAGNIGLNAYGSGLNIGTESAHPLTLYTGNSARLAITSAGNVGIGTTNPSAVLTVASSSGTVGTGLATFTSNDTWQSSLTLANTSTNGHTWSLLSMGQNQSSPGSLAFYDNTAAAYRFLVNSTGNVGIGTTTPQRKLDVSGDAFFENNSNFYNPVIASNYNSGANAGSGFYLGNDLDPSFASYILKNSSGNTANFGGANSLNIWNTQSSPITFATANLERMRIDASGNVGIASTTPWKTLSLVGTMAINGLSSSATGNYLCINTTTWEITRGNGSACTTSSIRFKENVVGLPYGLDTIDAMRPVAFNYKPAMNMGTSTHIGFIAEEMRPLVPEVVNVDANGQVGGIDYPALTAVLAKGIQEIAAITGTFRTNLIAWLGSATNGITDFFAGTVHTQQLCDGSTCVTVAQLHALLAASAASSATSPAPTTATSTAATSSPTLTLNGNNPAQWTLNTAWQDNLGALFVHDAMSETIYSTSTIDTTQPGTSTITYWAQVPTTQAWLTTTRDVVIPTPLATSTATSTP